MVRSFGRSITKNVMVKPKEKYVTKVSTGTHLTGGGMFGYEYALTQKMAWTIMYHDIHKYCGFKPLNKVGHSDV